MVDAHGFRDALGRFATGVSVITALSTDGRPVGVTVSSFCSLSLEPPLILFCLGLNTTSLDAYASHGAVAVNVSTSQPERPVESTTIKNIDGCLSAIGIVPAVTQNPDGTPARDNNNNNNNQPDDARYLHDWFQGNGSLMGLLEHDLLSQREGLDEVSGVDDLWP